MIVVWSVEIDFFVDNVIVVGLLCGLVGRKIMDEVLIGLGIIVFSDCSEV